MKKFLTLLLSLVVFIPAYGHSYVGSTKKNKANSIQRQEARNREEVRKARIKNGDTPYSEDEKVKEQYRHPSSLETDQSNRRIPSFQK